MCFDFILTKLALTFDVLKGFIIFILLWLEGEECSIRVASLFSFVSSIFFLLSSCKLYSLKASVNLLFRQLGLLLQQTNPFALNQSAFQIITFALICVFLTGHMFVNIAWYSCFLFGLSYLCFFDGFEEDIWFHSSRASPLFVSASLDKESCSYLTFAFVLASDANLTSSTTTIRFSFVSTFNLSTKLRQLILEVNT